MNHNYYEILEVSPNASTDVIEAVYKRLAKKYHPDLQKEIKRASAEDKMKELNLAYGTLKDPCRRKQYDAFLMKARSNSDNKPGRSTARSIQIIKAKVEKSLNTTMNYRHLLTVALILIFGITVLIIGLNTYNERNAYNERNTYNQPQIDITENLGYNIESSPEERILDKNDPVVPEDRFTLGSSQAAVKKVMGAPTSMFIYSWSYGASLIYFDKDGKVDGWAKIDKNLKAWLGYKKKNAPPFIVGSTKDEVINAMGTPSSVFGGSWSYGKSTVYFDEKETVRSWVEIDKHLRAVTTSESSVEGKGGI